MAFKDKLKELIEERGGMTSDNLYRIGNLARKVAPDMSMPYFRLLLSGGATPRPDDLQALAVALGVHPREFLEGSEAVSEENQRMLMKFATARMKLDAAQRFCQYIETQPRYRNRALSYDDLYVLLNKFLMEDSDESESQ